MMFCQLGYIRFDLPHYFMGFEDTLGFGFAEHPHAQGKPSLQSVGDPLQTRTLDMRFERSWCDPQAVFDKLVQEAAKKQAQALTFGDGTYAGKFVVTELQRTIKKMGPDGTLLWLDVRVSLREFVDPEPLVTAKRQHVAQAPALKKPAGKAQPPQVKKGKPLFTIVKETNKDGYTVEKIVRK